MLSRYSKSFLIINMSTTYTHQNSIVLPLTSLEIQVSHKLCTNPKSLIIIKAYIPTPRCLLQSLEGLLELCILISIFQINKTFRLYHIQPFLKKTIKETMF